MPTWEAIFLGLKARGQGEKSHPTIISTITPTEMATMINAQNRIFPLLAHAATPANTAADAYIPGQSHSIKNPNTNRIAAIANAILLTLAFTEAVRGCISLFGSVCCGG